VNIDPTRTAVLALHFQRDIVDPDGTFGGLLADRISRRDVLPRTASVLEAARASGVLVVYGRVCFPAGHPELDTAIPLFGTIVEHNALVRNTTAVEIVDEVAPGPDDVIVDHTGTSAFGGGELERLLQTRGIDTVVIAGVATNIVVDSTARDGSNRGHVVYVLADCCSAGDDSTHDASLATLELITNGVVMSDEFVNALSASAPLSPR
jgi:nicotinamidase-related amidase